MRIRMPTRLLISIGLLWLFAAPSQADEKKPAPITPAEAECHQRAVAHADPGLTLSEVRRRCGVNAEDFQARKVKDKAEAGDKTVVENEETADIPERRSLELSAASNPYGITPHRVNYLLPVTYSRNPNRAPFGAEGEAFDKGEVKFQFSYKVPLVTQLTGRDIDLFFAYTNQSWWQAFNGTISRPFRETNHEPELFFTWTDPWVPAYLDHLQLYTGLSHQSNGQSGSLSRSWNRLYVGSRLEKRNFFADLKLWDRIPDDSKDSPDDPRGDDNPDIERFMGHFELSLAYKRNDQSLGVLLRNNLRTGNNLGAIQIDYAFPLTDALQGYVQYFNGYGESLIDYNHDINRFGLGIAINEWP